MDATNYILAQQKKQRRKSEESPSSRPLRSPKEFLWTGLGQVLRFGGSFAALWIGVELGINKFVHGPSRLRLHPHEQAPHCRIRGYDDRSKDSTLGASAKSKSQKFFCSL